jgi:hypothetical protein
VVGGEGEELGLWLRRSGVGRHYDEDGKCYRGCACISRGEISVESLWRC